MNDKNNSIYYCQICGLECKEEDLYSYNHCVCCGCEFGYHDDEDACGRNIPSIRLDWLMRGAKYYLDEYLESPWTLSTLQQQLLNINVQLDNNLIKLIEKNWE